MAWGLPRLAGRMRAIADLAIMAILPRGRRRRAAAGMTELVDVADSKSAGGNTVGVRFPLPAPTKCQCLASCPLKTMRPLPRGRRTEQGPVAKPFPVAIPLGPDPRATMRILGVVNRRGPEGRSRERPRSRRVSTAMDTRSTGAAERSDNAPGTRMGYLLWMVASCATIATTALALLHSRRSWIRMWDFPRLQIALLGTAAVCVAPGRTASGREGRRGATWLRAMTGAAAAYQWLRIWRYTPLAPVEVAASRRRPERCRLTILEANVCLANRDARRLLQMIERRAPDVVLCVETDQWWCDALDGLRMYPHRVSVPLANTYGMMLMSRLPLRECRVDYVTEPDVPSVHARIGLPDGSALSLHCLHPRPPSPDRNARSLQRDAELVVVGERVRGVRTAVVCGDLNDVAWSRTSRRFQKISGLLDPRKGRGFFATFNAFYPGSGSRSTISIIRPISGWYGSKCCRRSAPTTSPSKWSLTAIRRRARSSMRRRTTSRTGRLHGAPCAPTAPPRPAPKATSRPDRPIPYPTVEETRRRRGHCQGNA